MGAKKPLRVGVYIPRELAEKVEAIMSEVGVSAFSRVVQEALQLYIAEHSWRVEREVVGAIGILYDHEVEGVDELLTDIQHKYLDVVLTAVHVHLDPRNCLLVVVVRGGSSRIKSLLGELERAKGVKATRLMLLPPS